MISTAHHNQDVKTYTKHIFRVVMKSLKDEEAIKEIDQKYLRGLWELKNKALRGKKAPMFMKGDIPYVVPLDSNNS